MASSVTNAVSIDRAYLKTLIRRAHLNSNDVPSSLPTITISRIEYDTLLKTAREFANLRRNLMRGGVTKDTLAVLTSDESKWQDEDQQSVGEISDPTQHGIYRPVHQPHGTTAPVSRNSSGVPHGRQSAAYHAVKLDWAETEAREIFDTGDSPIKSHHQHELDQQDHNHAPPRPQFERLATRTVLITNLPEGTTHADVTAVVQGGQLLEIFLRTHDRSAHVSFLHSADAGEFFEHARRHDLYIKHKRVDVRWSDRQFILPSHVAGKIGIGATRNLVIRRCDPNLTEETIREDLEHIHNLVIVRVTFKAASGVTGTPSKTAAKTADCYISTNSVHNAMFARTCMMSRIKYKGSKIDWDMDECARPIEKLQRPRIPTQAAPTKRAMNPMANRFELLRLEGNEEEMVAISPEFRPRVATDIMA